MSDVAKAAGVSAATVSRALRGEPGVSEATRQHVSEVARRMKYAIARDASSLAGGRRYAIAVLTSEVSPVLAGAEGALRQAGYDVLLYVLGSAEAREKFFDELPLGRRVDGVLLLSISMTEAEQAALESLEVPHITVDDADLRRALQTAVAHLQTLGHHDVALVLSDGVDESYDEILSEAGLEVRPEWTVWCSPTVDGGEQVVDVLLDGERLPTAVISSNGAAAVGIYLRMQRDGRAVPDEVSIVSLDGQELTRVVGLTAVEGAAKEQGERAVADLFTLIRGGEIEPAEHPVRLVVRNSSGPVPQ
ncbi:LacI family DNA-binding transcriptional regulator [Lentzea flava]|uniref:LacI family transcriptional regulator n=1 Tax=Lentzea flava TaxID=103732 RepID=A0ABQ2V7U1_9PSEU|nr:LacI family DNA-binding transcriptional regulator [Lentzea flava]MCP2203677.1 transcriptional regulator, LacI family [Lentzea flava]GGU70192.1 LacI family transcriptional regulator [Lentzea flava]